MKPNSSLAKVQTFLHIQNLPNKKLVRQVQSISISNDYSTVRAAITALAFSTLAPAVTLFIAAIALSNCSISL